MAMDAKDLRTEAALSDRSGDGNGKYDQGGGALSCHRNKTYQDIGSNSSLAKVDSVNARPCAVIGPDRVVPPAHTDVYYKKGPPEPWLALDVHRQPPDYPHKLLDYQLPSRNISPRQTFQENMQRILVPPTYHAGKLKEDHNFPADSNIHQMSNNKLSVPSDSNSKYCDVPYTINPLASEPKTVRNPDGSLSNMNVVLSRSAPHAWPPSTSNISPPKPIQELRQYADYQNCTAPRPMVMTRPHRNVHEEPGPVYPDGYYHNGNLRFKPYPAVKERYPQTRYDYYSNPFHPPSFQHHKYDLQKQIPPHPYPSYQQVPLKYMDNRMADPIMNGYQRSFNQQAAYNSMPFRNQIIHPPYGPVPGNCLPTNKYYPYPPDAVKSIPSNKLPFDPNSKLLPEYDNRSKNFSMSDAFYINGITRPHNAKAPVLPNYPTNIHAMPTHTYYRKDSLKGYEYGPHFRNMDHMLGMNGNHMSQFPSQFSPSAFAISPSDSNTSNDTNQTQGVSQEDCGYVSQSSTASARSMDSVINKVPSDIYRRYDQRYTHSIKNYVPFSKNEQSTNCSSKEKKDIDVRQFLQMWNEGEEEGGEGSNKEVGVKSGPNNSNNNINAVNCGPTNQQQLYVLGLVNVPSEELGKYQHIQKVSKLPENIKGYNSIELLHQFEEVVESSNLNSYHDKTSKSFHNTFKSTVSMHAIDIPSRPLSPLDVEAKISQSVIHKEVGCNFEIKPCSPKMLNVEVATPLQTVIGERMIEKVSNPLTNQSPLTNDDHDGVLPVHDNTKINSCKMVNKPYGNKDFVDHVKTNYSIQDLESNSGVCLASLPRLDNDIELNFPEVNQQFINANKVESVITTGPVKDLPSLVTCQVAPINRDLETKIDAPLKRNLEKDISKLSKYRKVKRKNSAPNIPESSVQALRTDSVIIKNPENYKYDHLETPSPKILRPDAQNDPINLSVNTDICSKSNTLNFDLSTTVDDKPNDFAIDFSINSNDPGNFTSSVKVQKISSIDDCNLKSVNVGKERCKKILLSTREHECLIEVGSFQNEKETKKPDKCKNKNQILASTNESIDMPINDSPTCLQENFNLLSTREHECLIEVSSFQNEKETKKPDEFKIKNPILASTNESIDMPINDSPTCLQENFNLLSTREHECLIEVGSFQNEKETKKPDECKIKNQILASTNESIDMPINGSPTCLQENFESANELNMELQGTQNCNQSQNSNATDKEALDRKLTNYNLLSSQEKEDTLSEKMRELFGEEFSTVETESDYEQMQDILDDNSARQRDCIFSDDEETKNKIISTPAVLNDYDAERSDKEYKTRICKPDISETSGENINLPSKKELHEKSVIESASLVESLKNNATDIAGKETRLLVNYCIDHNKRVKTDVDHIKKEMLSPWIQKLIIHDGGSLRVLRTKKENTNHEKQTKIDVSTENIKTNDRSDLNAIKYTHHESDNNLEISKLVDLALKTSNIHQVREIKEDNEKAVSHMNTETKAQKDRHNGTNIDLVEMSDNSLSCANSNSSPTKLESNCLQTSDTTNGSNVESNCLNNYNTNKNMIISNTDQFLQKSNSLENDCDDGCDSAIKNYARTPSSACQDILEASNDNKKIESSENDSLSKNTRNSEGTANILETNYKHKTGIHSEHIEHLDIELENHSCPVSTDKESVRNYENLTFMVNNSRADILETKTIVENELLKCGTHVDVLEKSTVDNPRVSIETDVVPKSDNLQGNEESLNCSIFESGSNSDIIANEDNYEAVECIYSKDREVNNERQCKETFVEQSTGTADVLEALAQYEVCYDAFEKKTNTTDTETAHNDKVDEKLLCSNYIAYMASEITNKNDRSDSKIDEIFIGKKVHNEEIIISDLNDKQEQHSNKQIIMLNTQSDCCPSYKKSPEHLKVTNFVESDETMLSAAVDKKNLMLTMSNENHILRKDTNDPGITTNYLSAPTQEDCHEQFDIYKKTMDSEDSIVISSCQAGDTDTSDKQISEEKSIVFNSLKDIKENARNGESLSISELKLKTSKTTKTDFMPNKIVDNLEDYCYQSLQEVTSSADVSGRSDTTDDENTSDSTDSNVSMENINTSYDTEHKDKFCKKKFINSALSFIEGATDTPATANIHRKENVRGLEDLEQRIQTLDEIGVHCNSNEQSSNESIMSKGLNTDLTKTNILYPKDLKTKEFYEDENVMNDTDIVLETHEDTKHSVLEDGCNEAHLSKCLNVRMSTNFLGERRKSLKRSSSDSAINDIRDSSNEEISEKKSFLWPRKRKKDIIESDNYETSQLIAQNICRVLQNNRRNSISSITNEGNVSFCILIDNNCIISEECVESDKVCFSEVSQDCLTCIPDESLNEEDSSTGHIISLQNINCRYSDQIDTNDEDNIIDEPWVEDVACVETVVSDDIAENIVISASASPKGDEDDEEETEMYNINEHTEKLKYIYGDKMYTDDAHFVETLYRTPQMNVNQTLNNRESQISSEVYEGNDSRYYDKEALERVLTEPNFLHESSTNVSFQCRTPLPSPVICELTADQVECRSDTPFSDSKEHDIDNGCHNKLFGEYHEYSNKPINMTSCESSEDDVFISKKDEEGNKINISSSPEVSSTTSEDKKSCILLKITNYSGSGAPQDINPVQGISCKYTEKRDYSSSNGKLPTKTLLTKAAQKYIPPLKETICDLKVKLPLPHQSLMKFKQLKLAKENLKTNLEKSVNKFKKEIPKKPKPKFEDVLKSIDEMQFQKHKESNKKSRKSIPKVVIKKNEHGSHYASTSNKHSFNPDLTGRKWQPWVFLEKQHFIDKMALRNKTRAVFSHRKKMFVLAEKFQKYKSVCNPKFVITQPKQDNSTTGQLKYTIKLKHHY